MRFVIAFAVLVAGVGPGWAQAKDPYAKLESEANRRDFQIMRERVLANVSHVYFALGCKVFPSEAPANALSYEISMELYGSATAYKIIDRNTSEKIQEAKRIGLEKSKNEGCSYWEANVNEALSLRRQALSAIQSRF